MPCVSNELQFGPLYRIIIVLVLGIVIVIQEEKEERAGEFDRGRDVGLIDTERGVIGEGGESWWIDRVGLLFFLFETMLYTREVMVPQARPV